MKSKMKAFTLIELMIVMAIIGILTSVFIPYFTGQPINVEYGFNGLVETRCINGYQWVVDSNGRATQVMDTAGHGVQCYQ